MRIALIDPSNMAVPYVDYLASALAKNGHTVSLWASQFSYASGRPALSSEVDLNDHFYRLSNRFPRRLLIRRFLKGVEHYFDMRRLAKRLQAWAPDVIHYQQPPAPLIDSWTLSFLKSICPVVITVHNLTPIHGEGGLILRRYDRLLDEFDSAVVHTETAKKRIAQTHNFITDVSLIRPGLYDHYKRLNGNISTEQSTTEPNKVSFLIFGGIRNYKGIDVAIRAYAAIPDGLRNRSTLTIAGTGGSGVEAARKTASTLGIANNIQWDLRFIPDEEVESLVGRSDALLMTHLDIDLSGILMVAIDLGRPFLASGVGCFNEYVVDGTHGLLSEPGNISALTDSMVKFLENTKLRNDLSDNMRSLAESWPSWESVADRHVDHYRQTIAAS